MQSRLCQDIAGLVVGLKEIKSARDQVRKGLYKEIKKGHQILKGIINESYLPSEKAQPESLEPLTTNPLMSKLKLYDTE